MQGGAKELLQGVSKSLAQLFDRCRGSIGTLHALPFFAAYIGQLLIEVTSDLTDSFDVFGNLKVSVLVSAYCNNFSNQQ
jgi:hypothetical protein